MIKANFMEKLLDGVEVEWKPLGEIAENIDSMRKPVTSGLREFGNIPYYGASGIVDYVKDYIFEGDFLLISEDGANLIARNTPIAFSVNGKIWVNNHAHVLKFKTYEERRFVEFYLNHIDLIPYISGAAQPKLNQKNLNSIMVPNPLPLGKNRIVSILDTFTELTAELTAELIARKKQYTYYRDKLLTFEKGEVEWKSLGEIGKFVRGNGLQKSDFAERGVGCIHYGQIYTYYGNFAYQTKSFVSPTLATKLRKAQKGDLIIATTSETIEDVCKPLVWLGEEEVCVSGETYVFKHNQNPKYLAYYLQTPMFFDYKKQNRTGTKVIRVHGDKLAKFEIPIPPLTEQERIVSILDKFDVLTSSITEGLPHEIELRQKQYEYYRNMLLSFPKEEVEE